MKKYLGYLMLLSPFIGLLCLYISSFGVYRGFTLFSVAIGSTLFALGFVACGAYLAQVGK